MLLLNLTLTDKDSKVLLFYFIEPLNETEFSHELTFYDEKLNEIRRDEFSFPTMFRLDTHVKLITGNCYVNGCSNRRGYRRRTCKDHHTLMGGSKLSPITMFKNRGYRNTFQTKKTQGKIKNTSIDRYGVDHPTQSEVVKRKVIKSNLSRYGVEHTFQSMKVKEKIKNTFIDRHGVEYSGQALQTKDAIEKTNLTRYGVKNVYQSTEIQEKIKLTNIERYGVENIAQSDHLKQKQYLEKYGVTDLLDLRESWREVF